jgi:hypothetical protein
VSQAMRLVKAHKVISCIVGGVVVVAIILWITSGQSASYNDGYKFAMQYKDVTLLLADHVEADGGTAQDFCAGWEGVPDANGAGNPSSWSQWMAGCTAGVQQLVPGS